MKRYLAIMAVCLSLGFLAALAFAQASAMKSVPAQGYTPESWVLTPDAKDSVLLCAAPTGGGTLACRPAGEFRAWVRDRKAAR